MMKIKRKTELQGVIRENTGVKRAPGCVSQLRLKMGMSTASQGDQGQLRIIQKGQLRLNRTLKLYLLVS
ncbi:hypothetical protein FGO68_gene13168 [Halteria grandinella]|uniref:Uncharacterized protein n=1 Tax=Halteria grandinella TaxID=5974 RepID=A0A8J8P493_HALGN|nr:hypothetical protein FGO68_gene13168 [Halteria grandinella]